MTYQLLDSVEEDKVYHGIKIRMILNIALFESLAERPAWRNLQNFTFALSLRPPRVALRKERSTACGLPLSFYESPVWKSVSKAAIHNLAPSCQVIITLFEKK